MQIPDPQQGKLANHHEHSGKEPELSAMNLLLHSLAVVAMNVRKLLHLWCLQGFSLMRFGRR